MVERSKQVFRVTIDAPIQEVWETLTAEGCELKFFFGSVLHTTGLAPGAPIRMRTPDGKYTGVVGDVIEYDPPRRYSHTFKFTHVDEPPARVTYELRSRGEGTELTLIAEDMPAGTATERDMVRGGDFIVRTLKAVAEKKPIPLKCRFILWMCRLTRPLTPKACLSVNWPLNKSISSSSSV